LNNIEKGVVVESLKPEPLNLKVVKLGDRPRSNFLGALLGSLD
jgi:hypothetical protein